MGLRCVDRCQSTVMIRQQGSLGEEKVYDMEAKGGAQEPNRNRRADHTLHRLQYLQMENT